MMERIKILICDTENRYLWIRDYLHIDYRHILYLSPIKAQKEFLAIRGLWLRVVNKLQLWKCIYSK